MDREIELESGRHDQEIGFECEAEHRQQANRDSFALAAADACKPRCQQQQVGQGQDNQEMFTLPQEGERLQDQCRKGRKEYPDPISRRQIRLRFQEVIADRQRQGDQEEDIDHQAGDGLQTGEAGGRDRRHGEIDYQRWIDLEDVAIELGAVQEAVACDEIPGEVVMERGL